MTVVAPGRAAGIHCHESVATVQVVGMRGALATLGVCVFGVGEASLSAGHRLFLAPPGTQATLGGPPAHCRWPSAIPCSSSTSSSCLHELRVVWLRVEGPPCRAAAAVSPPFGHSNVTQTSLKRCCAGVAAMAGDTDVAEVLLKEGAVEGAMMALRLHGADPPTTAAACLAMVRPSV